MRPGLKLLPCLARSGRLLQLTYLVSDRCNLRCPFCFRPPGDKAQPDNPSLAELSLAEVERLAPSLGRPYWLLVGGGEPFLRPDLAEVCRMLLMGARPAILTIASNGSLPEEILRQTRAIVAAAGDTLVVVKLSLDALGARHDELRGWPGGFARVMETYSLLRSLAAERANLELGFNSVLTSQTLAGLPELLDYVAVLPGRPAHTLSLARGARTPAVFKAVAPKDYLAAARRLEAGARATGAGRYRFRGAGFKAALDEALHRLIHQAMLAGRRPVPCLAGRRSLVLEPGGEVRACEVLEGPEGSLGNLRDFGLDLGRLMASPRARATVAAVATGSCSCTHECNLLVNLVASPRLAPALARRFL
jgi:MoaA/NifB/PqqE/SkfB family radical SAM enzyme